MMRYMGSKGRYAKYIVPIIMENHNDSKWYVEPFLGGGNIFSQVPASYKWGNDTAKYAVALLQAISTGWTPPTNVSEYEYNHVRENTNEYDDCFVGFVAYCCSYSGKLWGGYWRAKDVKGNPRNPAFEQSLNLIKQSKGLLGSKFTTENYFDLDIEPGSTVYCDPPYEGTTGYKNKFDHSVFWQWCDELVFNGCNVFVSEYNAPNHWKEVWRKEVNNSLTKDTGAKKGIEKLFTRTKGCL